MDVATLQALVTLVLLIKIKKSKISCRGDRLSLFASRTLEKREVDGYYYGSLCYANLVKERQRTKKYEKGVIA